MVPCHVDDPGALLSRNARDFLKNVWSGRSWMAIGKQDPVLGPDVMNGLRRNLRGCAEPYLMPDIGHFVQEHGEVIAVAALKHFCPG
jgi:tRNA(adenine34) deaminase